MRKVSRFAAAACVLCGLSLVVASCAVVPKNRRQHLADPTMAASPDPLEDRAERKMHMSREGANGGDGQPAGGGCACTN